MSDLKVKKAKKGFLDGYKTYDPSVEGYGNPDQWKHAFNQRMGYEEAKTYVKDESPYEILGLVKGCSLDEVKKQFRKLIMKFHPDVCKDSDANEKTQKLIAAYTIITEEFK
jgi:DnaJ-class molecular chaperone